jgi:hypothetical protein
METVSCPRPLLISPHRHVPLLDLPGGHRGPHRDDLQGPECRTRVVAGRSLRAIIARRDQDALRARRDQSRRVPAPERRAVEVSAADAPRKVDQAMGHVAHRTVCAGTPISSMDRLAMPRHRCVAGSSRLGLQQHGEERIRRGCVPRHGKRRYFPISDLRFILRSAYHRPAHHIRGRNRHSRVGATNVSSIQRRLTASAALHQLPKWGPPSRSSEPPIVAAESRL